MTTTATPASTSEQQQITTLAALVGMTLTVLQEKGHLAPSEVDQIILFARRTLPPRVGPAATLLLDMVEAGANAVEVQRPAKSS